MMYRVVAILLFLTFSLQSTVLAQQILPPSEYVKWRTTVSKTTVPHGESFSIQLEADIAAPWKLYAMDSPAPSWGAKLNFDPLPAGFSQVGEITQSPTKVAFDKNFKTDVSYFNSAAAMQVEFKVDATAATGFQVLSGKVGYQICNDDLGVCLPPKFEVFTAELDVVGEAGSSVESPGNGDKKEGGASLLGVEETGISPMFVPEDEITIDVEEEPVVAAASAGTNVTRNSRGLGGFILLAIGAGLGALLMPCVFPMIPLTVSYFTKHSSNKGQAFRLAGVYGLSIIVIFTGLGILAALLLGASGAQMIAANPWINLFIGLTFVDICPVLIRTL